MGGCTTRHLFAAGKCLAAEGQGGEWLSVATSCVAQARARWPWGRALGHSGGLGHTLMGIEDVTLEGQAECHMVCRLGLLHSLLPLGHLPLASSAPLLEAWHQDLLGLGAEATCRAQRESLSLCHSPACPLNTLYEYLYLSTSHPLRGEPGPQHALGSPLLLPSPSNGSLRPVVHFAASIPAWQTLSLR